jgi:membrane protein
VFLIRVIPVSSKFVQENLLEIIKQRGTVGILGLIGLIWSASGVFLTLTRNINRAWPGVSFRNFLQSRLLALVMILVITLLLALWFLATTFFSLLPKLDIPIQGSLSIYDTFLWRLLSGLIPWIIAFIVFVAIYRWIPKTHVRWSEAMWGAAFATIAWESATMLFTWYLSSGLTNYELLYGSLGTILALLTWIYLSALITLFGAHLSAAIAQNRRLKKIPEKEREVEASHHPTLRRSI